MTSYFQRIVRFLVVITLVTFLVAPTKMAAQNIDRVVVKSGPQVIQNVVFFGGETADGKYVRYRMEISTSYRCRTGRNGWCKDSGDLSPSHISLLQESYARDIAIYLEVRRSAGYHMVDRGVIDIHEKRPAGFNPVDPGK